MEEPYQRSKSTTKRTKQSKDIQQDRTTNQRNKQWLKLDKDARSSVRLERNSWHRSSPLTRVRIVRKLNMFGYMIVSCQEK